MISFRDYCVIFFLNSLRQVKKLAMLWSCQLFFFFNLILTFFLLQLDSLTSSLTSSLTFCFYSNLIYNLSNILIYNLISNLNSWLIFFCNTLFKFKQFFLSPKFVLIYLPKYIVLTSRDQNQYSLLANIEQKKNRVLWAACMSHHHEKVYNNCNFEYILIDTLVQLSPNQK